MYVRYGYCVKDDQCDSIYYTPYKMRALKYALEHKYKADHVVRVELLYRNHADFVAYKPYGTNELSLVYNQTDLRDLRKISGAERYGKNNT